MKLLELCGYEPKEIERELPRVKKAFSILGITSEDIERAEKRVEQYFDISLKGMRKILGLFIKDSVDLALAGEEGKIVIASSVPGLGGFPASCAAEVAPDKVWGGYPQFTAIFTLGSIFDKLTPVLEAGEDAFMTPGAMHCGCCTSRTGLYALNMHKKADLHVGWDILCDEAPKTDDLIEEFYGVPVVHIDRCQDEGFDEKDPQRHIDFVSGKIKKATERVGEVTGINFTDELVLKSLMSVIKFFQNWVRIGELVKSDPIPLSQADMNPLHIIMMTTVQDRQGLIDATDILIKELEERVNKGIGVLPKGASRIMIGGLTPMNDPSVVKMIEGLGLGIPVTGLQIFSPHGSSKIEIGDLTKVSPWEIMVKLFMLNMLWMSLKNKGEIIAKAAKYWNIDGLVWLLHSACREFATDALMLKDYFQKISDIPVIVLDGDLYDTRVYTAQQLRTRMETFAEILRMRKAA